MAEVLERSQELLPLGSGGLVKRGLLETEGLQERVHGLDALALQLLELLRALVLPLYPEGAQALQQRRAHGAVTVEGRLGLLGGAEGGLLGAVLGLRRHDAEPVDGADGVLVCVVERQEVAVLAAGLEDLDEDVDLAAHAHAAVPHRLVERHYGLQHLLALVLVRLDLLLQRVAQAPRERARGRPPLRLRAHGRLHGHRRGWCWSGHPERRRGSDLQ